MAKDFVETFYHLHRFVRRHDAVLGGDTGRMKIAFEFPNDHDKYRFEASIRLDMEPYDFHSYFTRGAKPSAFTDFTRGEVMGIPYELRSPRCPCCGK